MSSEVSHGRKLGVGRTSTFTFKKILLLWPTLTDLGSTLWKDLEPFQLIPDYLSFLYLSSLLERSSGGGILEKLKIIRAPEDPCSLALVTDLLRAISKMLSPVILWFRSMIHIVMCDTFLSCCPTRPIALALQSSYVFWNLFIKILTVSPLSVAHTHTPKKQETLPSPRPWIKMLNNTEPEPCL